MRYGRLGLANELFVLMGNSSRSISHERSYLRRDHYQLNRISAHYIYLFVIESDNVRSRLKNEQEI